MSVIMQILWKLDKRILLWEICWFWTTVIEVTADTWRVCWRRLRFIYSWMQPSWRLYIVSKF